MNYLAIAAVWGAVAFVSTLDVASILIMAPCAIVSTIVLAVMGEWGRH